MAGQAGGQKAGRHMGSRRGLRLGAAVVALVALVIAGAGALAETPYPAWAWRPATNVRLGIELHYPRGWSVAHFENDLGLVTHTGVLVSNVDHDFEYPELGPGSATSAWDMTAVADDAVLIEISRAPRFAFACKETSSFPLPAPTEPPEKYPPSYGAPANYFIDACIKGRPSFGVFVYFFPDASALDRVRAWQVVGSIRRSTG